MRVESRRRSRETRQSGGSRSLGRIWHLVARISVRKAVNPQIGPQPRRAPQARAACRILVRTWPQDSVIRKLSSMFATICSKRATGIVKVSKPSGT